MGALNSCNLKGLRTQSQNGGKERIENFLIGNLSKPFVPLNHEN